MVPKADAGAMGNPRKVARYLAFKDKLKQKKELKVANKAASAAPKQQAKAAVPKAPPSPPRAPTPPRRSAVTLRERADIREYRPEDPPSAVSNRGRSASPTRPEKGSGKNGGKGKGKESAKGKKGKTKGNSASHPLAGRK